jgi:hypothetical protein
MYTCRGWPGGGVAGVAGRRRRRRWRRSATDDVSGAQARPTTAALRETVGLGEFGGVRGDGGAPRVWRRSRRRRRSAALRETVAFGATAATIGGGGVLCARRPPFDLKMLSI